MLNTTNYGSINNFLSIFNSLFRDKHFNASSIAKSAFADSIIKGLGSNLEIEYRKKFAMQVFQTTGEKPSNLNDVLNVYYDPIKQTTLSFEFDPNENIINDNKVFLSGYPLIKTSSTKYNLHILKMWLENNEPFIVVGPEGAGKSLLITYATYQLRSCQITTLNCTSQTSSTNIIQKLLQSCTMNNTSRGKCLRPRDCQKLIVYLKDSQPRNRGLS